VYLPLTPSLRNLGPQPMTRHFSSVRGERFKYSAAYWFVKCGDGSSPVRSLTTALSRIPPWCRHDPATGLVYPSLDIHRSFRRTLKRVVVYSLQTRTCLMTELRTTCVAPAHVLIFASAEESETRKSVRLRFAENLCKLIDSNYLSGAASIRPRHLIHRASKVHGQGDLRLIH
jgi:hypothetical protein